MSRPERWAQPIDLPGVPNLHKVSELLYRSAQPTQEGMKNLKRLGIRTVINLRLFHSDSDELVDSDLMHDEHSMAAWYMNDEDSYWFLDVVDSLEGAPFLVHCLHGADRTGCMIAMYRMVLQFWTKEEAIKELVMGGFGFHGLWVNIPVYLRDVDVIKIRKALDTGEGLLHRPPPEPPQPEGN